MPKILARTVLILCVNIIKRTLANRLQYSVNYFHKHHITIVNPSLPTQWLQQIKNKLTIKMFPLKDRVRVEPEECESEVVEWS